MGKALGRGFESLIPDELYDDDFDVTADEDEKVSKLTEIELEKIKRDENQPRKDFSEEALSMLADSIKKHGVLQPIVVTKEEDSYKIVAGERRWRAAKMAGLKKIPVIVRSIDAQNRLELSIIENAQREDLNAIELATAYMKLKTQFNLSAKEIATKIGKSEKSIEGTIRLLRLPEEAKKIMVKERLSEGVMKPLVSADPEMVMAILPKIVEEGWTARKVERYISENKKKSSTAIVKANLFAKDEERISKKYNATTKIHGRSITITCKNKEELKKLIEILK
ncbi:ParB/RepB/Spo0J family partition protein [Candidatus Saccharibacteria bacterium]|nr:ParB/RepB/Spo0J family partition protein [Candidatus Saccharibacteria bacterium]